MYKYRSTDLMFHITRSRTGKSIQKRKRNQKCEEVSKYPNDHVFFLSLKTSIPININYHMPNRLRHANEIDIVSECPS